MPLYFIYISIIIYIYDNVNSLFYLSLKEKIRVGLLAGNALRVQPPLSYSHDSRGCA